MGYRQRRWAIAAAVAFVATAWTLVGPVGPASAAHVSCGATITQNTVLDSDVGDCGSTAITIAADNITLDLAGHTVSGLGNAFGDGAGVYVFRRTGVTVKNGTVTRFDGGVVIEGGGNNLVTGVTARDNVGIVGTTKYDDGFAILSSVNNRIVANKAIHNGPLSGIGVYTRVDGEHPRETSGVSRGNVIENNQVIDTNLPRNAQINDSDGIRIETLSVFNTIRNNQVSGSGLDGISLFSFTDDDTIEGNQVTNNGFLNTFRRRGDGIRVFGGSHRHLVRNNTVFGNAANGIIFHGQFMTRPPVLDSTSTDNTAVGNNRLPPLEDSQLGGPTYDLNDGNPNCDNNTWRRNTYHTANPACTTIDGHQA